MVDTKLTHTDEVVLGILKKYTNDIQVKKDKLGTVFELTFSKDSGNLNYSRTDPDTLVQHGIEREVCELVDTLCNSSDVDFATYGVSYTKCDVLTVWYNTAAQRNEIESSLKKQKLSNRRAAIMTRFERAIEALNNAIFEAEEEHEKINRHCGYRLTEETIQEHEALIAEYKEAIVVLQEKEKHSNTFQEMADKIHRDSVNASMNLIVKAALKEKFGDKVWKRDE